MKNKKGFTLMELLAAIFIGGMVMSALVLVWKTASTQTSQGQRQTIIRNQISNFRRQLYKDFYGADIITYPQRNSSSTPNLILAGLKKAKRVGENSFETFEWSPKGPTTFFAYCLEDDIIKRYEIAVYNPQTIVQSISSYEDNKLAICRNEGVNVLTHFILTGASLNSGELSAEDDDYNGIYHLKGYVQRVFKDAANTTPIYVEINEKLISNGGI